MIKPLTKEQLCLIVEESKNKPVIFIGDDPDYGPKRLYVGGQDLRELLVRVRGLLTVYVPIGRADATLEDLTNMIAALDGMKF